MSILNNKKFKLVIRILLGLLCLSSIVNLYVILSNPPLPDNTPVSIFYILYELLGFGCVIVIGVVSIIALAGYLATCLEKFVNWLFDIKKDKF